MKRDKVESEKYLEARRQNFIEIQNTCPLCNSDLMIRVESYLEDYMLREEASCPNCQVLARVKDHKMH
ncbi:MAG: hypothetical protein AB7F86_13800 [Bdellovibrionales bacterium]